MQIGNSALTPSVHLRSLNLSSVVSFRQSEGKLLLKDHFYIRKLWNSVIKAKKNLVKLGESNVDMPYEMHCYTNPLRWLKECICCICHYCFLSSFPNIFSKTFLIWCLHLWDVMKKSKFKTNSTVSFTRTFSIIFGS